MGTFKLETEEKHAIRMWYEDGTLLDEAPVDSWDPYCFDWTQPPYTKCNTFQFFSTLHATVYYPVSARKKTPVRLVSPEPFKKSEIYVPDGTKISPQHLFKVNQRLYGSTPPDELKHAVALRSGKARILPHARLIPAQSPNTKDQQVEQPSSKEDHTAA